MEREVSDIQSFESTIAVLLQAHDDEDRNQSQLFHVDNHLIEARDIF